jgi:hypothetical protein
MHLLIRLGVAPKHYYLICTRGRHSGRVHTTPVWLVEDGERYVVAPYGDVSWVKNARASGEVTLIRGLTSTRVKIVQLDPPRSAPILKTYLINVSVARPFFDTRVDSPLEAFTSEATRHPVFKIIRPAT